MIYYLLLFLEGIVFPRSEKSIFGPKKSGEIMNLADLLTNTALNDNDPLSTIWSIENTDEKPEKEISLSSQEKSIEATDDNFEDLDMEFTSNMASEKPGTVFKFTNDSNFLTLIPIILTLFTVKICKGPFTNYVMHFPLCHNHLPTYGYVFGTILIKFEIVIFCWPPIHPP